ncbi:MAG: hypothetical protein GF311_00550 [Candidatus Lokiarchaeota archaeon]|nr:hypothetical protein [Candidatus Lokiarchaeota archaeon]
MIEKVKDWNYDIFSYIKKIEKLVLLKKTKKIIKILEFEIKNGKLPNKLEYIRILDINWEDVEDFIEILNNDGSYNNLERNELKKMAERAIRKIEYPNLYEILILFDIDFKTAKKIGQLLIDENFIEHFPRIPKKEIENIAIHNETSKKTPNSISLIDLRFDLFDVELNQEIKLIKNSLLYFLCKTGNSILKKLDENIKILKKIGASFWDQIREDIEYYKNGDINLLKLIFELFKKLIKKIPNIFKFIKFNIF